MAVHKDKYLIWWTNQSDHERVALLTIDFPLYILNEFRSRCGRAGRGRLWIHGSLTEDTPSSVEWDDKNPVCQMAADAGGIVIRSAHHEYLRGLPGFVTDFSMNLIR